MFNIVYSCMNGWGKTETFHRKMKPLIRLSYLLEKEMRENLKDLLILYLSF